MTRNPNTSIVLFLTTLLAPSAFSQQPESSVEEIGELPVTIVETTPEASTTETRSYNPPVRIIRTPGPELEQGLIIGEAVPDGELEPAGSTFLPSTGLELLRIETPQDVVKYTPNQSATDSGSRSFGDVYSSRGLTNTVFFGSPGTTIYVDDVPFGETFTYAQDLTAINSIEVYRGPQPSLVGRNTYGGLINIRSRRPSNTLEGQVNYSYGSFESHDVDAWVMGPITEKLGFRLGGQYDSHDGFLTNTLTGRTVDFQKHRNLNGGLFFEPGPGWEISFTASYDEYDDGAPRLTSLDRTTGFYTVGSDIPGEQFRRTNSQALRVSYENEDFRLLSVTSHRGFELDPYTIDLDFTPLPIGFTSLNQSQELWSQELRISDNNPDADWGWRAGLYGSASRIHGEGLRGLNFTESRVDLTTTNFIQPIPTMFGIVNVPLTANSTSYSESAISLRQLTTHTIDEESFAAFGGVEYRGFDSLTFDFGGRLDWVKRSLVRDKSQAGLAVTDTTTFTTIEPVPGFPPFPDPPVDMRTTITPIAGTQPRIAMQDEWVHFTPSMGVEWEISEDTAGYARTSYAFKPGGFSAYADNVAFVPFDEERVWASEIGVRSRHFDDRLETNLAFFYNEVENYQVERSFSTTDYAVFNADDAEIYGIEFESSYSICPTLDFFASFGWTHATLVDYTDPVTGVSLDGVTPPFVPEYDAVLALDYHLDSGFFARLEYLFTGDTTFDDFNRRDFEQDAFGLVNAMIGWRENNWTVSVYGSNLAEEEYYTNINPEVRTGAVGLPREYGVRVGLEF